MKAILFSLLLILSCASAPKPKTPSPVVYGVSPSFISSDESLPGLDAIRLRLPEIKELGANVIWLMPITPSSDEYGPGYDVVDYHSVWHQLGGEKALDDLVQAAHAMDMKVMLDVVLNHSSSQHPYVQDIVKKGLASEYYALYQHEPISNVPYAQHFHQKRVGEADFIFYFWSELFNFNYNNKDLREYLFKAVGDWVRKYDIDGFRFDASWGPSSRWPQFYSALSSYLREIKPELILLAEDVASYPARYQGTGHPHLKNSGFDWAYDWDSHGTAISKWVFQVDDDTDAETVFNWSGPEAAKRFYEALRNNRPVDGIKALRYVENNDSSGILVHHNWRDAKWAVTANFLLPGVPMIFYGQETGMKRYHDELPGFNVKKKMASHRPEVFRFYKNIIEFRQSSEVLSKGEMDKLQRPSAHIVTYELHYQDQKADVLLDFNQKKAFVNGQAVEL